MNNRQLFHSDNYPLVTVGLPTRNGERKIAKALRSVLDQKYANIEIIISDNCSTDNTEDICKTLCRNNPCIKYFRQSRNIGPMSNFEFVLQQASGDFFMWLSDDDSLEPDILHRYVYFLINNPDYTLVSGAIQYWIGERKIFCERDFNMRENSGFIRLLHFYFKVVYGSAFYGLMRKNIAQQIPLQNRIGDDWHFVATLAYLGKIKNLDMTGYNKRCGGISRNFKAYAQAIGAAPVSARHPHAQIACDAFDNILHDSAVFRQRHNSERMLLALCAFLSVLISFYGKQYPFILGGRLKRWVGRGTSSVVESPVEL